MLKLLFLACLAALVVGLVMKQISVPAERPAAAGPHPAAGTSAPASPVSLMSLDAPAGDSGEEVVSGPPPSAGQLAWKQMGVVVPRRDLARVDPSLYGLEGFTRKG